MEFDFVIYTLNFPTLQRQTLSFQFIVSHVWYNMEKLVRVKVCQTINSPNTLHTLCLGQVGRIGVKMFVSILSLNKTASA